LARRTDDRLSLLATATVGEGGWVDQADPIIVRAGDAFVDRRHRADSTQQGNHFSPVVAIGLWLG
jgi:hypothetical protein